MTFCSAPESHLTLYWNSMYLNRNLTFNFRGIGRNAMKAATNISGGDGDDDGSSSVFILTLVCYSY